MFPDLQEWLERIPDKRNINSIDYDLDDILLLTILMFLFRYNAMRPFIKEFKGNIQASRNLESFFNIFWISDDETFRYAMAPIETSQLNELIRKLQYRLERKKKFKSILFMDKYYLTALDGTGQITSYKIKCNDCLTRTRDKKTLHMHYVLNASLTDINSKVSLCSAFEPINNSNRKNFNKNDHELEAAKRLFENMKKMYPKRKHCFLADALYAVKPILKEIIGNGWHFIITCKPDRNVELFRSYDYRDDKRELIITEKNGVKKIYRWTNALPIKLERKEDDFFYVNMLEFWEHDSEEKITYYSSWVTDFFITKNNIVELARAGRARFAAIENRSFNEQKSLGYGLDHNYGHKGNLPSVFYGLLQVAHMLTELFAWWKTGRKLIQKVGSKKRFFIRAGVLLSSVVLSEPVLPIVYVKFQWDTS